MEITLIGCFGILCLVIVLWRPLSVIRKDIPNTMTHAIKHGDKLLRVNIMEDEVSLQNRYKKIREAKSSGDWIDGDALWDEMHPSNE
jgi:hypothetical protein